MRRFALLLWWWALVGCNRALPPAPPEPPSAPSCEPVGPAPLRRLSRAEYDATVRDLLGDVSRPARTFPPDEESQGFDNYALTQSVSPLLAERYLSAAESLAAAADLTIISPCDPLAASASEEVCVQRFLAGFGRRAFRRPLTAAETGRLAAIFSEVRLESDYPEALRAVLTVILQAPQFLYRFESVPLTDFELASRLSYFLWGSQPDEALLDAAQTGSLDTLAQARRMLADSRARSVVQRFHLQWLGIAHLEEKSKDPVAFADFPELAPQLQEETARFTEWTVFDGNADARRLFNGHTTFLNARLAQLYGFEGIEGTGWVKLDTELTARTGVLTQGSVLSAWSKADQTSPVLRGKLVRERFLCQTPEPPPGNVVAMLGTPANGTTRERFAAHRTSAQCNGCHQLLDPIGFGLEKYGPTGAYRGIENGLKVDARGEVIAGGDLDGTFDGALELSERLAQSRDVKRCLALQWFRFAFGRGETSADACSVENAQTAFEKSGWNTRELLIAITQTDAFRRSGR
jgi:hypothetical protein